MEREVVLFRQFLACCEFLVRVLAQFEKDYLAGVYGGIPLIEEFDIVK